MLRIYADFNGLVAGPRHSSRTAVVIDTLGSLRDLANAGLTLREGLSLITYDESDEDEDLEGHGVALYDPVNRWWVVEFDEQGVRYVPAGLRAPVEYFLCIGCRQDLSSAPYSLPTENACPHCGTSIQAPIAPPP